MLKLSLNCRKDPKLMKRNPTFFQKHPAPIFPGLGFFLLFLVLLPGCGAGTEDGRQQGQNPGAPLPGEVLPVEPIGTGEGEPEYTLRFDMAGKGSILRVNGHVVNRFPKTLSCFSLHRTDTAFALQQEPDNAFIELAAGAWSEVWAGKIGSASLVGGSQQEGAWDMAFQSDTDTIQFGIESRSAGKMYFWRYGDWGLAAAAEPSIGITALEDGLLIGWENSPSAYKFPLEGDSVLLELQAWGHPKEKSEGTALVEPGTNKVLCILDVAQERSKFAENFQPADVRTAILNEQSMYWKQMKSSYNKVLEEATDRSGVSWKSIDPESKILSVFSGDAVVEEGGEVIGLEDCMVRLRWRPGHLRLMYSCE